MMLKYLKRKIIPLILEVIKILRFQETFYYNDIELQFNLIDVQRSNLRNMNRNIKTKANFFYIEMNPFPCS